MSMKLIEVSPTKAYRVEAIKIDGEKYISIRQMYRNKKQAEADDNWNFGRQGVTIPLAGGEDDDIAVQVAKTIGRFATREETKFKTLDLEGRKKKDDDEDEDEKPAKKGKKSASKKVSSKSKKTASKKRAREEDEDEDDDE